MTTARRRTNAMVLGLVAILPLPAAAGWLHLGDSVFQARRSGEAHPESLERTIVVPTDLPSARVCVNYNSSLREGSLGTVIADIEVERDPVAASRTLERISFSGPVRRNALSRCRDVAALSRGDVVFARLSFRGFPALEKRNGRGDWVNSLVSVGADLELPGLAPPELPSEGLPDPNPDPLPDPDPAGSLSPEDQGAVLALWNYTAVALRREHDGWTVDTRINNQGVHDVGLHDTIDGAVTEWAARRGLASPGPATLSRADIDAILQAQAWVVAPNGVAIRFESNGVTIDTRLGQTPFHNIGLHPTIAGAVNEWWAWING